MVKKKYVTHEAPRVTSTGDINFNQIRRESDAATASLYAK